MCFFGAGRTALLARRAHLCTGRPPSLWTTATRAQHPLSLTAKTPINSPRTGSAQNLPHACMTVKCAQRATCMSCFQPQSPHTLAQACILQHVVYLAMHAALLVLFNHAAGLNVN